MGQQKYKIEKSTPKNDTKSYTDHQLINRNIDLRTYAIWGSANQPQQ